MTSAVNGSAHQQPAICTQPDEEGDGEVCAQLRLGRLLDCGGGVKLVAEPRFRAVERRHGWCGECSQADPEPARVGVEAEAEAAMLTTVLAVISGPR
jgi:hypothetical protein